MSRPPSHRKRLPVLVPALALAWAAACAPATASDDGAGGRGGHRDHDRAREARALGEIRPIVEILELVADQVPGEIVEIELERDSHRGEKRWLYELKVLTQDGRRLEVEVDAARARILTIEAD